MRRLAPRFAAIAWQAVARNFSSGNVLGCRLRVTGRKEARQQSRLGIGAALADHLPGNELDRNRAAGTGLRARRRFADREPAMAHITLANDAARRGIPGHIVRAFQDAVLATNALVIEVPDDAGSLVFFI